MNLTSSLLSFTLVGAEWVLYLLIGLSIGSVMLMVERAIVMTVTRSDVHGLQASLSRLATGGEIQSVRKEIADMKGIEASVLRQGLDRAEAGPDAVEEVIAGLIGLERIKLERGIAFLGTVGSNAPFIGLFGTVLGIIKAFHDLSMHKGGGSEVVMSGISEALVATAVGLMVAIPAVMSYNFFQRRIKQRINHLTALSHLVLAGIKSVR